MSSAFEPPSLSCDADRIAQVGGGVSKHLAMPDRQAQNARMAHQPTTSYLKDSIGLFHYYKKLGERAMAQCPDEGLFLTLDAESNSIAIIVKHMAGNMRSRWTNFLTTDGEKPDRNRDTEFEDAPRTRAELMAAWERGWKSVFDALESMTDADMERIVTIRREPHSVMQAINRQIAHYAYHVGQIIFLAKHLTAQATGKWESLSVARGKSAEINAKVAAGEFSQRSILFASKTDPNPPRASCEENPND